jgi:hypothetical protein
MGQVHFKRFLILLVGLTFSDLSAAGSHSFVNMMRSSETTHIFVSQGIDGEFGDYQQDNDNEVKTHKWKGYGFTTTFGLEVFKFIQFTAAHSFMNMQSTSDGLEKLDGSRFLGGARLVFQAPVANLELGGGAIGTRYDYQKELETSSFYGSGYYYSLGLNYFLSSKVSLHGQAKVVSEHNVRSGGSAKISNFHVNTTAMGVGFSLWL